MRRAAAWALLAVLAACGGRGATPGSPATDNAPLTRAERTHYAETSRYADVTSFLDSLRSLGVPMYRGVLGASPEGRAIPMIVLSRPAVRSPAEAHALHRPVIYIQANIHAGEVEGKEALLALIRDLARKTGPSVLDSLVLIAVPIYNGDGNERVAPQAVNRTEQNGPELVGQRANGQGLDLNRDYVKGETPETRASYAALNAWDPDVFVDLHTTDGSFHGYALTYAPSLNPAAIFGGAYARDSMLPELRTRMRSRRGFLVFDYGNFSNEYGADVNTDTLKAGWFTYDARPRFGTNMLGLRGRIAILAEGYSHDPFDRRVRSMYDFVGEILAYTARHGAGIMALSARADSSIVAWGASPNGSPLFALQSALTRSPHDDSVISEDLAATHDSSLTQPGVPRGLRRTGHYRSQVMPIWVTFAPTLSRRLPFAYVVLGGDSAAERVLRMHGVALERTTVTQQTLVQQFIVDSVRHAERVFQGHHETTISGRWRDTTITLPAGALRVRVAQPLGLVAFYLLEPESDDGLTTWNLFDALLAPGNPFPVVRVPRPALH